jgi:hypothetical protein
MIARLFATSMINNRRASAADEAEQGEDVNGFEHRAHAR